MQETVTPATVDVSRAGHVGRPVLDAVTGWFTDVDESDEPVADAEHLIGWCAARHVSMLVMPVTDHMVVKLVRDVQHRAERANVRLGRRATATVIEAVLRALVDMQDDPDVLLGVPTVPLGPDVGDSGLGADPVVQPPAGPLPDHPDDQE